MLNKENDFANVDQKLSQIHPLNLASFFLS